MKGINEECSIFDFWGLGLGLRLNIVKRKKSFGIKPRLASDSLENLRE